MVGLPAASSLLVLAGVWLGVTRRPLLQWPGLAQHARRLAELGSPSPTLCLGMPVADRPAAISVSSGPQDLGVVVQG